MSLNAFSTIFQSYKQREQQLVSSLPFQLPVARQRDIEICSITDWSFDRGVIGSIEHGLRRGARDIKIIPCRGRLTWSEHGPFVLREKTTDYQN